MRAVKKIKLEVASRGSDDSENGVSDSAEEMDTDDDNEDLSIKPLAKLLQGAGDLIRGSEDSQNGKRTKLRQEVIDIRRLKDVGGVQPVSHISISAQFEFSLTRYFCSHLSIRYPFILITLYFYLQVLHRLSGYITSHPAHLHPATF